MSLSSVGPEQIQGRSKTFSGFDSSAFMPLVAARCRSMTAYCGSMCELQGSTLVLQQIQEPGEFELGNIATDCALFV